MPKEKKKEEYVVSGEKILEKVNELIKEGNARKILIKNEKKEVILEVPLTIGVVGTILAPVLAAICALAALITNCTIEVIRKE